MSKVRAKFFKDDDGQHRDMVEISIIGDPNTLIRKVTPEDVQRFPRDWEAYQAGEAEVVVVGTPLTDVPGIDKGVSLALELKGVRTAEELAALVEAATKGLGMGMTTFAQSARLLLKAKQYDALEADTAPARRGPGRPPKSESTTSLEV